MHDKLNALTDSGFVEIRGARQNNLKGFDLDLPLGKLNVISGPSGSGKSSLAFDTIYAEGQRRYVETFSPYTRQFLERMDKPKVDEIRGIPPAIAIEQSNNVKSTRSTVGTMTEINDYLKVLMPRIARAHCPSCSREIRPETARSIVDQMMAHAKQADRSEVREASADVVSEPTESPQGSSAALRSAQNDGDVWLVTFGVPVPPKTEPMKFFEFLKQQGYLRVWIEDAVHRTDAEPVVKRLPGLVRVIQDRLTMAEENRPRITEAVETALRFGKGQIAFLKPETGNRKPESAEEKPETGNLKPESAKRDASTQVSSFKSQVFPYSSGWHCAHCDIEITPPTPGLFSFNNPLGACPKCRGFGRTIALDIERAIPDRSLSIAAGVVKPFQTENGRECQRDLLKHAARRELSIHRPFEELPKCDQDWILYGDDPTLKGEELWENDRWYGVKGFFDWLETKTYKMHVRVLLSRYRSYSICPDCNGGRFQPATLNFRIGEKTLPEIAATPVGSLLALFTSHFERSEAKPGRLASLAQGKLHEVEEPRGASVNEASESLVTSRDPSTPLRSAQDDTKFDPTAQMLRDEVATRLRYLVEVGLGYLTLDRATRTLSGGEVERVNLTTCLGASLVNTLFVMDEPSIGLHPRDVGRLIRVMKNLRDKGNTLLVVEHEESIIRAADNLIELGPGRGEAGGDLVNVGQASSLPNASLTRDYLTGKKSIPVPKKRRASKFSIKLQGASQNNLRGIDVDFPLGVFTCVTGVSGSGKSTLIHDVLYQNLLRQKGTATGDDIVGACKKITGAHRVENVVMVDQSPLSRTPRSSPAVYLGVFDFIREVFAELPEAQAAGLTAGSFSFNAGTGRCERCGGNGFEKIEMQFLSDLYVRCPECDGAKYRPHILKIKLRGKSIHDVLEMTVTEAIAFFSEEKTSNIEHPTSNVEVRSFDVRKPAMTGVERSRTGSKLEVRRSGFSKIVEPLRVLAEVGLGYVRLGQPLNVLSGGESQRLKLVAHLTKEAAANSLLIFDEPTTGLHFDDVAMLLKVFNRLVEQGNSLIVIEHNLEVIKCADHVIDLGPEAGDEGGFVVATGTPEEVAGVEESHTGRFLRQVLGGARGPRAVCGGPPQTPSSVIEAEDAESELRVAEHPPGEPPGGAREPRALPGVAKVANGANGAIQIHGAREHNLKDISLAIPRDKMVVITGLSGSGKSTLAFDILFAEGQRRFLDSMSPYARQFVEQLEKPDVDIITGLPPTVAIEQRVTRGGGKSTVATVTEVYHFLRLLFAKVGTQFCPKCNLPVQNQTLLAIANEAEALACKGRVRILAPLIKARKGFHTDVAKAALRQGFETLFVDGKFMPAEGFQKLERFKEHTIDVLVGEWSKLPACSPEEESSRRLELHSMIGRAISVGKGTARLLDAKGRSTILSTERSCPGCGQSFEELDPRLFSFNSPHGWCHGCHGFGEVWNAAESDHESVLEAELDEERQHEWLEDDEATPCPMCEGSRLNRLARHVRIQGIAIQDFTACSVTAAEDVLGRLKFDARQAIIAEDIVSEIKQRLLFMGKVGLDYLALNRSAKTLSGGESQRIRLAAQLGSNLRGVLYVLDEPTIGLHPRDNRALLDTLEALKSKGNSLVIVEHDDDTMQRADVIVDLGPGAGSRGGEVVAIGTLREIEKNPHSATGRCLREPMRHPSRGVRRSLKTVEQWIELEGACANNLKDIDARFPIGRLTVISGISGSGKSTLMRSVLLPAVQSKLGRGKPLPKNLEAIRGAEFLETVYEVDQSPIGKTSRSIPATYIGFFDEIRKQFATLPLARMRGYTASRFSFNTEGGRCETCGGQGVIKIEMNFLPTSYIPCSDCGGKRYNAQTLEVEYNGKSIGDVMDMTFEEAAAFFSANPKIQRPLVLLVETGLGYLKLGQPSPTLSGGEAQRLKLVTELTRGLARAQNDRIRRQRQPKSTLYLLEEPTIGLHMADVKELLKVLHRLVDDGNTVIVIEHNLSLVADADYVIDIGPEAGDNGGLVVVAGTPEQVAKNKTSRTAPFLREVLKK